MSKHKNRPYWQSEPCPEWCDERHRKHTLRADRRHSSAWSGEVKLSLEEVDVHGDPGQHFYSVPSREVYVAQGYREVAPRIVVDGGAPGSGRNLDLTISEALKLARLLTTAADIAEGHANPGGAS